MVAHKMDSNLCIIACIETSIDSIYRLYNTKSFGYNHKIPALIVILCNMNPIQASSIDSKINFDIIILIDEYK